MIALRAVLGTLLLCGGGGFAILAMVAGDFRKSFGASPVSPLIAVAPLVAMAVLLAALIMPAHRPLLHAGAIAAIVLVGFALWQLLSESATVMWFALLYLTAWFCFYAHALKSITA
jgi:hypothetical protein